eukprot:5836086-Heterocapsa_arctica.AAC.1
MPAYIPGFMPPASAVSSILSYPWFHACFKPVSRPGPDPVSYLWFKPYLWCHTKPVVSYPGPYP